MLQFSALEAVSTIKRLGAHLPHWRKAGAIYNVMFRLGDSLSQEQLKEILWEREEIMQNAKRTGRSFTEFEMRRLNYLHSPKVEEYLHNGHGHCWLRRDDIATIVANSLTHFEGEQYELYAWCIMPNHVHVVIEPYDGFDLSEIIHSWKSFSAKEANILLKRTGPFWRTEYYDHIIRNQSEFTHCMEYTWMNPDKAGLREWKWRWRFDDAV